MAVLERNLAQREGQLCETHGRTFKHINQMQMKCLLTCKVAY